jgi:hypothetical protein
MLVAIVVLVIIKSPIDMKKTITTILALLLTKLAAFAAVDLGTTTEHTPYDNYLSPVKEVFSEMHGQAASMDKVQAAMRQGRAFRYAHTEPYVPAMPQQTASRHVGDCKDKALWLLEQLQDPSARFVIGKMTRGARLSHAWVTWQHDGQWWILDCTMLSRPIAADKVGANEYVPLYSYARGTAFRHTDKVNMTADVAGKKQSPVAATGAKLAANN